MDKPGKKIIITAIACLAIGAVMLVFGVILGANFKLYVDGTGIRFATEHHVEINPEAHFSSINIFSNAANVEIKQGERGTSLSASLFTNYNDVAVSYYVHGNTLYIYVEKDSAALFYPGFGRPESVLSITVPPLFERNPYQLLNEGRMFHRLAVTNTSYGISINGLRVTELVINTGEGAVNIANTYGHDAEIITHSGNAFFETLEFLRFSVGTFYGNSVFENSMFYELIVSSQNGSFSFNGCLVQMFDANTRYGNITAQSLTTGGIAHGGQVTGHMYARNIFGEISLAGVFHGRANTISNNQGNITLNINSPQLNYDYRLSTYGNVYINGEPSAMTLTDRGAANHIRALSRSGDIHVTFID